MSVDVSASTRSEGTIGGERVGDTLSASYRLDVDLRAPEPGRRTALFSAADVDMSDAIAADDPGIWEWRLGDDGTLISSTRPALPRGNRLSEMLSTHGLFLMVPSVPVGDGATWTYLAPGSDSPIEVSISTISNDAVEASLSSRYESADGTITIGASGSWDRRSLMATQATSFIEFDFESTTTRNGEVVPVSVSRVVRFRYGAEE